MEVHLGGGRRVGDDGGHLGSGLATGVLTMMWAAGGGEGVIFLMLGCGAEVMGKGATDTEVRLGSGRRLGVCCCKYDSAAPRKRN